MITKTFEVTGHLASTLPPECIGLNESGWTIEGAINEDYYSWVNEFEAVHPVFGKVWGNFEIEVYADSEEGYEDFVKNHEPEDWDI
jgi:hypothetical protein